MTDRLSTYSKVVIAKMRETAVCSGCGETNIPGRKDLLDLMDDWTIYCNKCGATSTLTRPRAEPVG